MGNLTLAIVCLWAGHILHPGNVCREEGESVFAVLLLPLLR